MSSEREKDIELVKEHLQKLGEHFDSVHIFTSRHEPAIEEGTITLQMGIGNWFARYGQITEWTIKQDERARMNERKVDDE